MKHVFNKLLYAVLFVMISVSLNAQKYYYYYKGNKIPLELDTKRINVIVKDTYLSSSNTITIDGKSYIIQTERGLVDTKLASVIFDEQVSSESYDSFVKKLKDNSDVKGVGLFFKRSNNTSIGTSNLFFVQLKKTEDFGILQQFSDRANATIIKQVPNMPLWYILSTNNVSQLAVDLTNQYYESGLFEDVDPAFMFNFKNSCSNDHDFGMLWGLKNDLYPNYDINACDAWSISTGANVNVAIVDKGIDKIHNDLSANIHSLSFNAQTGYSPSGTAGTHGTHVAGTVAAIKDNNLQVVGVAPNSKLMSISHSLTVSTSISAELASGISWAWQNGASVINNSWGDQGGFFYGELHSTILENAIENAIEIGRNGKGSIVLFAAGNHSVMDYPSYCNAKILTVGAINRNGTKASFSGYGTELDVVAPGVEILSTLPNNSVGYMGGTSMACPHVAGVAALILSVNPDLTGEQVRDIIEKTAQKVRTDLYTYTNNTQRPNGAWNNEMGYGLVDAYAAVKMAQKTMIKHDLIVRDKEEDTGEEPSPGLPFWSSPDIWLTDYNFRKIQPYDLHKYSSCYIAVKVKNIGTEKSKGTEKLHVHWSRSSLRSRWRISWFEALHLLADLMGVSKGAEVTPAVGINIPSLQPNEEVTLYVLWNLPSQLINTQGIFPNWGFALLARLDDGLEISGENEDFLFTENFAKGSNNIAIGNGSLYIIGKGYKQVSELGYMDKPFVVGFDQIAGASHYRLGDFAEVYALLSPDLMRNLNKDKSKGIAIIDESSVLLQSPEAELHFNALDDKEGLYYVGAKVHFISDKMPDRNEFNFDLTLKTESDPKETLRFTAIRDESVFFKADADVDKRKVVKAREEVSLSSNVITDNAEYVWFDGKGTKIGEGSQISTTPDRSQKYKVSITKDDDGYRSYDEVEVIAVDGVINSISPNPASDNAVVRYKLSDNAFGVSLHISDIQNTLSVAYPLDTGATEKQISLSGFSAGTYIVKLVVGGTVVDSQNLIVY